MSRRAAWVLIALCAWTLYVWITRVVIIAGQDQTLGFKVVHDVLAVISVAFGLAAGWIGLKRLRADRSPTAGEPRPEADRTPTGASRAR